MEANDSATVENLPAIALRPGPRSGRPKGSRNRMTKLAKDAIQLAFDQHGGAEALVRWIEADPKNEREFYLYIYPKLLPLQVKAEVSQVVGMIRFRGIRED